MRILNAISHYNFKCLYIFGGSGVGGGSGDGELCSVQISFDSFMEFKIVLIEIESTHILQTSTDF